MAILPATSGAAWLPAIAAIVVAIVGLVRRSSPVWPSVVALVVAPVAWLVAIVVTVVSFASTVEPPSAQPLAPRETSVVQPTATEVSEPGDDAPSVTTEPEPSHDNASPAPYALGDEVEVGDWLVTIVEVRSPISSVGNFGSAEAQGEFVPIAIRMQNNGNEAEYFFAGDLVAIDDRGRQFDYSTDAAIYSGDEGASMLDEVNPGNAVSGILFYDVPEGTSLVAIEVENGWFDDPVRISLQ
jgi:hypothetical protein